MTYESEKAKEKNGFQNGTVESLRWVLLLIVDFLNPTIRSHVNQGHEGKCA